MTNGIQPMPPWSVDLSVLLVLLKLSHRLDSVKALEPLSLMTSVVLEMNQTSLNAGIVVLASTTVTIQKMQEFVVKFLKVCYMA